MKQRGSERVKWENGIQANRTGFVHWEWEKSLKNQKLE